MGYVKIETGDWINNYLTKIISKSIIHEFGSDIWEHILEDLISNISELNKNDSYRTQLASYIRKVIAFRLQDLFRIINFSQDILKDPYSILTEYISENQIDIQKYDVEIDCFSCSVSLSLTNEVKKLINFKLLQLNFYGWIVIAEWLDRWREIIIDNGVTQVKWKVIEVPFLCENNFNKKYFEIKYININDILEYNNFTPGIISKNNPKIISVRDMSLEEMKKGL